MTGPSQVPRAALQPQLSTAAGTPQDHPRDPGLSPPLPHPQLPSRPGPFPRLPPPTSQQPLSLSFLRFKFPRGSLQGRHSRRCLLSLQPPSRSKGQGPEAIPTHHWRPLGEEGEHIRRLAYVVLEYPAFFFSFTQRNYPSLSFSWKQILGGHSGACAASPEIETFDCELGFCQYSVFHLQGTGNRDKTKNKQTKPPQDVGK